jgi:hypothetical protein
VTVVILLAVLGAPIAAVLIQAVVIAVEKLAKAHPLSGDRRPGGRISNGPVGMNPPRGPGTAHTAPKHRCSRCDKRGMR